VAAAFCPYPENGELSGERFKLMWYGVQSWLWAKKAFSSKASFELPLSRFSEVASEIRCFVPVCGKGGVFLISLNRTQLPGRGEIAVGFMIKLHHLMTIITASRRRCARPRPF
jgi:hypothetical protein